MILWHISDTHGHHRGLLEPPNCDIVVFSGDESNSKNMAINKEEFLDFVDWFKELE